ncbi:recombination-associated protein RdgC [Quisquiliibacterium transsilvanicum]|uniref:Recombination-associated protein RdgC n=1 Tax=Quisquiliibacterium transsilvanicum TaxID=1549638 RepID=A0A7W8M7K1_9BURK|nr:recombination-associated protein RdgC [Quisquiliibacterium transsilvanicum]MBB5270310.1 recombination associated protein RdgC [Quisquiliibacterium transsilvanicum]
MWFKNLIVYRIPRGWDVSPESLDERLRERAFAQATSIEERSVGWVPPREGASTLVHSVQGQLLVALREEKKLLPAKVVTQVVRQRAEQIEAAEGFKPGRKRMKELKEQVRDELLPRAFSLSNDTRAWIDRANGWLAVDAASAGRAEEVYELMGRCIEGFPARPLKVTGSVAGAMTAWIQAEDPPPGFTVDQDVELKARGGKATVRYANQSLEQEEIARHVKAGKDCTKLALTWAGRISFLLTDRLEIRRVRPLDVLKEGAGDAGDSGAEERFDSDMMLMTGELAKLLDDLVDALGGEPPAQP